MSLQDKLDALKAKSETEMAPPEMVAVSARRLPRCRLDADGREQPQVPKQQ